MGPEGAEGDRGEIGLNGKEGPPGPPGLIGVRVSTSVDSSKFNSLSTIRQLFVSIYNPVRFFSSTRVRRVNPGRLEREENLETRFDSSRLWLQHTSFWISGTFHSLSSEWTDVPKSVHDVPVYTMSYLVNSILKWCCTLTEYLLIDVISPGD